MSLDLSFPGLEGLGNFCVPGTSVPAPTRCDTACKSGQNQSVRDPAPRALYLHAALAEIPRLLGAIDRNPYRATYGCLDRQFWHYRTASFPSEMYQEGALPLALACTTRLPQNPWHGNARVRELAAAAIRFAARSAHRDGSCDDYYPFERALGAAVFSLEATAHAYQQLDLDDSNLVAWFGRRAEWIAEHDETGRLSNHHALAALGLLRAAEITGRNEFHRAAEARLERLLAWQSEEGWFEEYGGADPGYHTLTIDCLVKIRRLTRQQRLDEPIRRAVAFARWFLHPDGSYAGEYGSRGTYHFYVHGFELLAEHNADAADLADGFLHALANGRDARFSDDRMFVHRLANLLEAYRDWSPVRAETADPAESRSARFFAGAGLLARRTARQHSVVAAARGGVFKHFADGRPPVTDAGLILETADGRLAASQLHGFGREVVIEGRPIAWGDRTAEGIDTSASDFISPAAGQPRKGPPAVDQPAASGSATATSIEPAAWSGQLPSSIEISGPLHWVRFETVSPWKQILLHSVMLTVGRWCRNAIRALLQRRLITGRREAPIRLTRRLEFDCPGSRETSGGLRVVDRIELIGPRVRVRRMSFGTDHQSVYVAAGGVYQQSVTQPWHDLSPYVDALNRDGQVTIERRIG